MEFFLRFAYPIVVYLFIPLLLIISVLRAKFYRGVRYVYPLTALIKVNSHGYVHPYKKIIFSIRFLALLGLIFLMGKPQLVDPRSSVTVNGIDIVLALDISGSMEYPHHEHDERSRIAVVKEEAVRFVQKRTNDAIGVVVFGNDALSRCPLTVDKDMLKKVVQEVDVGLVDPQGTVLSQSVLTAINRLRQSKSESKVVILLTDGEPSHNDVDPAVPIAAAQQLGIKIYTIGVGDNQDIIMNHPFYGPVAIKTTLNKPLLMRFASETGGRFFEAKSAQDMRMVYDTIDMLEKREIEAPVFSSYYDWFIPIALVVAFLLFCEIILSTFVWFSV